MKVNTEFVKEHTYNTNFSTSSLFLVDGNISGISNICRESHESLVLLRKSVGELRKSSDDLRKTLDELGNCLKGFRRISEIIVSTLKAIGSIKSFGGVRVSSEAFR